MKAPVKHISPNFAEGWNGKADPTDLPANAFSGKNWIPSWKYGGALEKVRVRRQDLLSLGTGSQDDRLYTPVTSGAGYRFAYPHLEQIEDVYFFYSNLYSLTTAGAQAAPTAFKMWHATPANMKVHFGVRLEKPIYVTTTKSLVVSIWLRRVGSTGNRLKLGFSFRQAEAAAGVPNTLGFGHTTTSFDAKTISTTEWTRVDIHFLASASTRYVDKGEYAVVISDTSSAGADTNNHYEIALADTASDPFGYAVCTNNSGTTYQALAECMVWRRKGTTSNASSQDAATVSAAIGVKTLRDVSTSRLFGNTPGNEEESKAEDQYWFSDKFSVYSVASIVGDTAAALSLTSFHLWDGMHYNRGLNDNPAAALTTLGKFIGRIESTTTYQRKFVMGGIGGISILDPTDMGASFYSTGGTANVAIPDIGNRTGTVSYEWITTGTKNADVYPPVVSNVFKAGINPGRVFATIGDTIIWSGGTSAATVGTLTSWSVFATVDFGDSQDTILKACWYKGYILLFTQNGDLYFFTGEPPIDPTNGYGTMRADYLCRVGQVSTLEVSRDGVWFAADEGRQLWFMDHAFVPRRVDDSMTDSIKVNNIFWDELTDRVWVASERHAKRSYLTAVTTDNTLTSEYQEACSYMLDSGKWYKVQRALDTDTTANQPDTFIFGPLAVKIGAYWQFSKTVGTYTTSSSTITPTFSTGSISDVAAGDYMVDSDTLNVVAITSVGASTFEATGAAASGSFYTIKSTPYALLDYADGFIDVYNTSANSADPENSDNRASSVTADLYTKELDFTEASGLLAAEGAIKEVFFSGYLVTGSTCTVYAVEQDGTETTIATITADASVSSPVSTVYRAIAGAMNRTGSARIKISVAGKYKDVIRNVGFSGFAYGQKGASA